LSKKKRQNGPDIDDNDILSILLGAEDTKHLDKDTLIQNCLFMLSAGDTTPKCALSMLYYLAKNPDLQERARAEVMELSKKDEEEITSADLSNCEYLTMFIKETLRIAPPVRSPIPRESDLVETFGGFQIPAHSNICYTTYGLHHNENYWPNPEKFDPERFSRENSDKNHPNAWIPFMSGSRNCLGQHMAILELKVFLIEMLKRYKISVDPGYTLKWQPSWVVGPKNLPVQFTPL